MNREINFMGWWIKWAKLRWPLQSRWKKVADYKKMSGKEEKSSAMRTSMIRSTLVGTSQVQPERKWWLFVKKKALEMTNNCITRALKVKQSSAALNIVWNVTRNREIALVNARKRELREAGNQNGRCKTIGPSGTYKSIDNLNIDT